MSIFPDIWFEQNEISVSEGNRTVTLTVRREPSNLITWFSIDLDYLSGTTSSDIELITEPQSDSIYNGFYYISANVTEFEIQFRVKEDSQVEADEILRVELDDVISGNIRSADDTAEIVIRNDDDPVQVDIADASVNEGGYLDFVITADESSSAAVFGTVRLESVNAETGDVVGWQDRTFVIVAGATTANVIVDTNTDADFDNDIVRATIVSIGNGYTIGDGQATGTIVDTTSALLTIHDGGFVAEGNQSGSYVKLVDTNGNTVTVGHDVLFVVSAFNQTAVLGADFEGLANNNSQTFTITAGNSQVAVPVDVILDAVHDEANETFLLKIEAGSVQGAQIAPNSMFGGGGEAAITIVDATPAPEPDPVVPHIFIDDAGSVQEGQTATFTVHLSESTTETVTVEVATYHDTAHGTGADSDYDGFTNRLITFNPGETTQTVAVATYTDTLDEGSETFTLGVVSATNATFAPGEQGSATVVDVAAEGLLSDSVGVELDTGGFTVPVFGADDEAAITEWLMSNVPDGYTYDTPQIIDEAVYVNDVIDGIADAAYDAASGVFTAIGNAIVWLAFTPAEAQEPEPIEPDPNLGGNHTDDGRLILEHLPVFWQNPDARKYQVQPDGVADMKYIGVRSAQGRDSAHTHDDTSDSSLPLTNSLDISPVTDGQKTYVVAPADAEVLFAIEHLGNEDDFHQLGNTVTLRFTDTTAGGKSVYMMANHLKHGSVFEYLSLGEALFEPDPDNPVMIQAGQIIGEMGGTGNWDPHLHMTFGTELVDESKLVESGVYDNYSYSVKIPNSNESRQVHYSVDGSVKINDVVEEPPVYFSAFEGEGVRVGGDPSLQDIGFPKDQLVPNNDVVTGINPTFTHDEIAAVNGKSQLRLSEGRLVNRGEDGVYVAYDISVLERGGDGNGFNETINLNDLNLTFNTDPLTSQGGGVVYEGSTGTSGGENFGDTLYLELATRDGETRGTVYVKLLNDDTQSNGTKPWDESEVGKTFGVEVSIGAPEYEDYLITPGMFTFEPEPYVLVHEGRMVQDDGKLYAAFNLSIMEDQGPDAVGSRYVYDTQADLMDYGLLANSFRVYDTSPGDSLNLSDRKIILEPSESDGAFRGTVYVQLEYFHDNEAGQSNNWFRLGEDQTDLVLKVANVQNALVHFDQEGSGLGLGDDSAAVHRAQHTVDLPGELSNDDVIVVDGVTPQALSPRFFRRINDQIEEERSSGGGSNPDPMPTPDPVLEPVSEPITSPVVVANPADIGTLGTNDFSLETSFTLNRIDGQDSIFSLTSTGGVRNFIEMRLYSGEAVVEIGWLNAVNTKFSTNVRVPLSDITIQTGVEHTLGFSKESRADGQTEITMYLDGVAVGNTVTEKVIDLRAFDVAQTGVFTNWLYGTQQRPSDGTFGDIVYTDKEAVVAEEEVLAPVVEPEPTLHTFTPVETATINPSGGAWSTIRNQDVANKVRLNQDEETLVTGHFNDNWGTHHVPVYDFGVSGLEPTAVTGGTVTATLGTYAHNQLTNADGAYIALAAVELGADGVTADDLGKIAYNNVISSTLDTAALNPGQAVSFTLNEAGLQHIAQGGDVAIVSSYAITGERPDGAVQNSWEQLRVHFTDVELQVETGGGVLASDLAAEESVSAASTPQSHTVTMELDTANAYTDSVMSWLATTDRDDKMSVNVGGWGAREDMLLEFVLPEDVPSDADITSATLRLHTSAHSSWARNGTIEVSRVTEDWDSTVTWNTAPGSADTFTFTNPDATKLVDIDLTDYVSDWHEGVHENHGIKLHAPGSQQENNSFSTIYADEGVRPELVLEYDTFTFA